MKNEWQLQTAKNRLSELVNRALEKGPQTITRRGKPVVVVVSAREYRKRRPESLWDFFAQSPLRGVKLDLERSKDVGRDISL